MSRTARVTFHYDKRTADIIKRSLAPELQSPLPRTQIRLEVQESGKRGEADVVLEIDAKDLNALRAALNSYLRWVQCIVGVSQIRD